MDISSAVYSYDFSAAAGASVSDAAFAAAFLAFAAVAHFVGPYVYGYVIYLRKEAERAEKKRTLKNLSMMKELQTELEEEMRKSLTNANLAS